VEGGIIPRAVFLLTLLELENMALPPLTDIAKQLSKSDIEILLRLKRAGPKLQKLEAKRKKLLEQWAKIDGEIAALEGGKAPGRKRGRPAKTPAAPAKRGRPPKVKPAAKVGRPVKTGPSVAQLSALAKARAARKTNKAKSKRTPAEQAAINARMAKARAARKKPKK